jgi:hypothetical protein
MGTTYTVKPGDNLSLIASRHGLKSWQQIYNDPANASFRLKRPNPNLIFPGDVLVIPGGSPGPTPGPLPSPVPPRPDPLTDPSEAQRIQALLDKHRSGARRMVEETLKALGEVRTAFDLFFEDPGQSAQLELANLFAVDGLQRFFAIDRNHRLFLPTLIGNFQNYLDAFPRLPRDQKPADFPTLVRDHPEELKDGQLTADTPPAFSDPPAGMFFTPRYREFNSAMPPLFAGFFPQVLQGMQVHEMGHFYFGFDDGDPRGRPTFAALKLAAAYDLLARQVAFKQRIAT